MKPDIEAANTAVRDVVVKHPATRTVFESFGIDYCCGGDRALADAASAAGADLPTVVNAIREAVNQAKQSEKGSSRSWADASLTELVDHIENTHHVFMKENLPRVSKLFVKVIEAHGENHGDILKRLQTIFSEMREEIEMHLSKEEQILFPYIREMEAAVKKTGSVPPMHCGTIQNPIRQMQVEHEDVGDALARMRSLTHDYTLPEDACPTFHALFDGLQEIEADLHEHIHLENNILFPRSEAMEAEGGT